MVDRDASIEAIVRLEPNIAQLGLDHDERQWHGKLTLCAPVCDNWGN